MPNRLAILALCLAAAFPLYAAEDDITSVISQQMDAFRDDDVATAFGFAAPGIRRLFGTPENFGAMVRQGYPMVWRPSDVIFLGTRLEDGATLQDVLVTDEAGVPHKLEYRMVEGPDGWQIAGVRILAAPPVGV